MLALNFWLKSYVCLNAVLKNLNWIGRAVFRARDLWF